MIVEDEIEIRASKEQVWQATIDVESWPEWSPAMDRIRREDAGDFTLGSTTLIKQKQMPEARWTVTAFDPGRQFTWQARVMGMDMIATHVLMEKESAVISLLRIEITGLLVTLFGFLMKPLLAKTLQDENHGLKRYCESGSAG